MTVGGGVPKLDVIPYKGRTDQRALILAGVHGSEQSGIEVVSLLIESLKKIQDPVPFFTVKIIPILFPANFEVAKKAKRLPGTDSLIGRLTKGRETDPNRNFPKLGDSLDSARKNGYDKGHKHKIVDENGKAKEEGIPIDSEDRIIEDENIFLLDLIDQFRPTRIASVHAHSMPQSHPSIRLKDTKDLPGIFVDPIITAQGSPRHSNDEDMLVLKMAAYVRATQSLR